jgi:hypothetical protein
MSPGGRRRRSYVLRPDPTAVVVLTRGEMEIARWPLTFSGAPDVSVVDELARLQLAARRMGCTVRVWDASEDLCRLLAFVGLAGAVGLQVGGEPEEVEEGGVEEVVVTDDPVA